MYLQTSHAVPGRRSHVACSAYDSEAIHLHHVHSVLYYTNTSTCTNAELIFSQLAGLQKFSDQSSLLSTAHLQLTIECRGLLISPTTHRRLVAGEMHEYCTWQTAVRGCVWHHTLSNSLPIHAWTHTQTVCQEQGRT